MNTKTLTTSTCRYPTSHSSLVQRLLNITLVLIMLTPLGLHAGVQEKRIVSAGGSITDIIFALGAGDSIVAADSTSMYPAEALEIPKIGYYRQLGLESVLSFAPTHLIGAKAMGPDAVVEQIQASGITTHILGEDRSLAGLKKLISEIGVILDKQHLAQTLIASIDSRVKQVESHAVYPSYKKPPVALFILSSHERGLTVAGKNTVPNALFDRAGIVNAAALITNYKQIENETIIQQNPDLIFIASHTFIDDSAKQGICNHPAIKFTKAGQNCHVLTMNSSMSMGLSTRFPDALEQIIAFAKTSPISIVKTNVSY